MGQVSDVESARGIQIWRARVEDWARHANLIDELLTPAWRARADQAVRPTDRFLRRLAYALLRHSAAMGSAAPVESLDVQKTTQGKPRFVREPSNFAFSFSHTKGLAVVATSHGMAIGVDVEAVDRRIDLSLLLQSLSDDERAFVNEKNEDEKASYFLAIWTLKEAILKATEEGLAGDLQSFNVVGRGEGGDRIFASCVRREGAIWQIHRSNFIDGYVLGVACRDDGLGEVPITHHEFSVQEAQMSPILGSRPGA